MSTLGDVREGLLTSLATFLELPANSAIQCAWPNYNYDPTPGTTYIEPFNFIDPADRATLGTNGSRRQQGRFQINIHGAVDVGPTPLDEIADRLLAYFDPKETPTITEGSTIIRIGSSSGQTLPYTVEPVTNEPWRTKPVIVPWMVDYDAPS